MTKLRKFFAYLFFILSALSFVECFISKYNHGFDYFLVMVIPLLVCGIICLFVKKHTAIYCLWTLFGFSSLWNYVYRLTHWRLFSLYMHDDALKERIAPALVMFAIFLALVIITVSIFCKKTVTDSKKHIKKIALTAVVCVVIRNWFTIIRLIVPQEKLFKLMEREVFLSRVSQWSMSSVADFLFIILVILVTRMIYTKIKNK